MRLRLTVQRHNLPASNILWNVPDTSSEQAYTFARLLDDVNRILPLESGQWGLEDYTVEVAGFECLHFSPVLQTLKEDDHVSIRPLLTAEVRSRTLCGRNQISDDGRHLVDGIPFGRPYLRQPQRPAVKIPPRKRQRLENDTVEESGFQGGGGFITEAGESTSPKHSGRSKNNKKEVQFTEAEEGESDDSEDDEDFIPGHVSEGSVGTDSDSESSSASDDEEMDTVAASTTGLAPRSECGSDSDDSDFDSDASSDSSSNANTDIPSGPTSDDSSDTNIDSDASSDSTTSSSDSSDSDSESSSAPEIQSSRHPVPPGLGSKGTHKRNVRRRQAAQLKDLKNQGKLPPDATYADLRTYQRMHSGQTTDSPDPTPSIPAKNMAKSAGKRKRLDEETQELETKQVENEAAELERRKKELMARLADDIPDVEMASIESSNGTTGQTEQTETSSVTIGHAEHSQRLSASPAVTGHITEDGDNAATPPTKRLRPNVSAIGRILQRQAVNIERKPTKPKKAPVENKPPEPEGFADPSFWKSKINVSAFECWDEEHELSAPPFPFEQHWDPASKIMRDNTQKKRKKKSRKSQTEIYDNEDQEPEDTPILDYDDVPETVKQTSDTTAAIENQLLQDVELAAMTDLPALPEDVDSLSDLKPSDVRVGAIVVFKTWTIDPKTVTPHISHFKTATVEREGDSGGGAGTFRLKLAERDVVPKARKKERDARGNPIQSMIDDDDEDEDASVWEGMFAELVTPKLLKAA